MANAGTTRAGGGNRSITKKRRNQGKRANTLAQMGGRKPKWQSANWLTGIAVGVVVLVAAVFGVVTLLAGNNTPAGGAGSTPVTAAVLNAVANPSSSVLTAVGTGGQSGELSKLPGVTVTKGADGKPLIVYVGAEYCPYCAAERWVIVMWLSRFGTFTGLHEITSSSTDVDPNTNSFTFVGSKYSSPYVDFSPNEVEDRNQNPLQSPNAQDSKIFTTLDQPPYTGAAQAFPFIDLAGQYNLYTTSYDPKILAGLSWAQIGAKLSNATDPVTKAIVGNANILTAATCIVLKDTPAGVCMTPTIQSIEPALKAEKVPTK